MTDTAAFEHISYAVADHVATITLNRPDKLNAFTATMALELIAALDVDRRRRRRARRGRHRRRPRRSAPVPTSPAAATRSATRRARRHAHRDGGGLVTLRIFECLKPVIGAINGPSVGIGTTMQLPMDMRLASTEARFGFVFARRGHRPRGGVVVVPAADRRHQPRAGVV